MTTQANLFNDYRPENIREANATVDRYSMHQKIMNVLSKKNYSLTFREIASLGNMKAESVWKRLSELEREGMITTDGKKKCSITGKSVTLWKIKTTVTV